MLIKKLCCCDSEGRKMQQRHLLNVEISFFFPPFDIFPMNEKQLFFRFPFFRGLLCCSFDLYYDDFLLFASVGQIFSLFFLLFFSKTSILEV